MLVSGPRTVTAVLRIVGLAGKGHFPNYHRVLNRSTGSARQASRLLLGIPVTCQGPPGALIILGADDTVERRSGRKITASLTILWNCGCSPKVGPLLERLPARTKLNPLED